MEKGKICMMTLSAADRRELLNKNMADKIKDGFDCFSCVGHCCTYEHNSMRVTPLEAKDIVDYLVLNNRINQDLIDDLKESIRSNRLDKEVLVGKNQELRRYYTCPFYKKDKLGCTIGKHHKPYGCLAFNPHEKKVSVSGHCTSNVDVLEKNHHKFSTEEEIMNENLMKEWNIYWNKKDIPSAVLFLINKLSLS